MMVDSTHNPTTAAHMARLVPEAITFNLEHNAEKPFFVFAQENSQEVTTITHFEFARAAHRVAHRIRPERLGPDGEIVAFMALTDSIVYQAVTAGIILAGLVPFPISPRNSPAAVVNLLRNTSCHRMITTQTTMGPLIDDIRALVSATSPDFSLEIQDVPLLEDVYPRLGFEVKGDPFTMYPSTTVRPQPQDLCIYLHSSGSTGFPKPIPLSHRTVQHWCLFPAVREFRDHVPPIILGCMPLPPFHTLGFHTQLLVPLYGLVPIAMYPPLVTTRDSLPMIPSPENILDHTRRTHSNGMITIPAFIQIWAQSSAAIEILKSQKIIAYSGGSLAPKLGDFLASLNIPVYAVYGGTEFGSPTHIFPLAGDEKEWSWMRFDDRASIRWIPQGDGTYECQFLSVDTHQPSVENIPDVKGYATADIWQRHPTKSHLWKIVGRVDDVIIHSSGEKTVPAPIENIILSSPFIQRAVMFGREHDIPGIIIEPNQEYTIDVNDVVQVAELKNKIWPIIEEANKIAPAFSRVFKEMIIFASREKPFPLAAKGTVMRKAALQVYDEEITTLYDVVESGIKASQGVIPPTSWQENDIRTWILAQAESLHSGKAFSPSADLFEQGFDSLSATFLRHRLLGALRASDSADDEKIIPQLTSNIIYSNPTVDRLSAFISKVVANPNALVDTLDRKLEIEQMIERYSAGFPTTKLTSSTPPKVPAVVLLTGSTGNLGSQILADLLVDDRVQRVYTVNRPSETASMLKRHETRFIDRGLDPQLLSSEKVAFLAGDALEPQLGLGDHVYEQLRDSVTLIIHNAWRLDFNLALASFESNISATRNLLDLALASPQASSIRFLFTSSVASAQSWNTQMGLVPEEPMADATIAIGGGYGEGKYVSEQIVINSGLQASSFRIGQISGGMPNGAWSVTEWVPALVKTSLALGALPLADGVISLIPMDAVAQALVDVAFSENCPPTTMNLVHPKPVGWNTMISSILDASHRELGKTPSLVPFREWFVLLEKHASTPNEDTMKKFPALKILDFFRGLAHAEVGPGGETGNIPVFSTSKVEKISPTIATLKPIGPDDASRWVRYWRNIGFLE